MAAVISTSELRQWVARREDVLLVDVLPPSLHLVGHLPGSANIPLSQLEDGASVLPRGRQIVVYCAGPDCPLSERAVRLLEERGFSHVLHYRGGLEEWEEAGYPVEETV